MESPKRITTEEAKEKILALKATKGDFIITFIKADGTPSIKLATFNVPLPSIKNGEKKFNDEDKGLITFFDTGSGAFRSCKVHNIRSLTIEGKTWEVYES